MASAAATMAWLHSCLFMNPPESEIDFFNLLNGLYKTQNRASPAALSAPTRGAYAVKLLLFGVHKIERKSIFPYLRADVKRQHAFGSYRIIEHFRPRACPPEVRPRNRKSPRRPGRKPQRVRGAQTREQGSHHVD